MRGAVILLEALLVSSERHVRDLKAVHALLALAHITGGYATDEHGLVQV